MEFGYCTEFLLKGTDLDLESIRSEFNQMGEHVLVVGDERTARIHIHTFDPGAVLSYGVKLGTLHRIKIDNMEEQHQEFTFKSSDRFQEVIGTVSTVTVASGEGLIQVFASLGATEVVPGGETMNPSVEELLQAVSIVPTDEVIILPNNPDILATAKQVCEIAKKKVSVVPSRTIMQGISALVAFNFDADLETNVGTMIEAMSAVRTGRIATATRSIKSNHLVVEEGQMIGFIDDDLAVERNLLTRADDDCFAD